MVFQRAGNFAQIPLAICSIRFWLPRIAWLTRGGESVPHNRWPGRMRDPSRNSQRWILALVLLSYLTTSLFASHYGYSILLWDDSEYVGEALDTADHVTAFGLPSWLGYVVSAQHYSKPPLYVNLLAFFIHLVGRARTPLAIALLAAVTSALLGIA